MSIISQNTLSKILTLTGDFVQRIASLPSRQRLKVIVVVTASLISLLAAPLFTVNAVHNIGLFQLDGNIQCGSASNIAANGPDWGCIFNANGQTVNPFSSIANTFIKDQLSVSGTVDNTVFVGSNKNNDPISAWHWGTQNNQAKDDLSNVYAYAALNPGNNHLIIYSGFERISPSGDSHIDLEFFQQTVATSPSTPPCTAKNNTCPFIGARTAGDTIVSMDFLVGGTLGSISIHKWVGSATVGSYQLVETFSPSPSVFCNAANTICGLNNAASISGGNWTSFDSHGNVITSLPANAFTEFGVDVTAELGGTPCFSTTMGKTRSSQSFTATLEDFAGPSSFPVCTARIGIAPTAVNEVGATHTFTVTVSKVVAGATSAAPDGTTVTVNLAPSNGVTISNVVDNCATTGTINGVCTVSFTSPTGGIVTATASATVFIGGVPFPVTTNGMNGNSGPATKTFVDAFITIGPPIDTNSITEGHTFTVTVKQNSGNGAGFVNAPNGTPVTVTLTPSNGAMIVNTVDTCASPGTSAGICTVTFTSTTTGTVTAHASVTLVVLGVTLTRQTNGIGQNSGDANKFFVAGSIRWTKVDNAGNLLEGATFQICQVANIDSDTNALTPITPVCNTVVDNNAPPGSITDQDSASGKFLVTNLVLGNYTVHETVPPPGFTADTRTATIVISIGSPNGNITQSFGSFVDLRPILKVTGFGYTDQPTGTPTAGVVSGTAVYTVTMHNFGGSAALLSGQLVVTAPDTGSGFSCTGTGPTTTTVSGCTLTFTSVTVTAGGDATFTLTLTYSNLPNGDVVTANLTGTYTTTTPGDTLVRTVSDTPATISFTIQAN